MIENLKKKIKDLYARLTKGDERSARAKRNILQMFLYRGGNIVIGFVLVPLTLHYVSDSTYGIWLALSSMIAWLNFFDIGINNGLRNRLTEAIAHGDTQLGRKLVSTTYALLTLIIMPLTVLLLCLAPVIDWAAFLNLDPTEAQGLVPSICIIIVYFGINFVINTINIVIYADQEPADVAMRTFFQQLVALVLIFVLTKTTQGNLVLLCSAFCFAPLIVCLAFNITLFRGRYKAYAPSLKSVDFHIAPDLMRLSGQFFIIQIAGVIQYQLINFIILRYFGASEVTSYNIAYKYFSVLVMVWGIIVAPIWNAVTDAKEKGEYKWIENMLRKYLMMFLGFTALGIVMVLVSPVVYRLWVGREVASSITMALSWWVCLYCLAQLFSQLYVNTINGTGKLMVQTISCIFSPLIFLGVCWLCIKCNIGIISLMIAAIVCNFNGLILAPLQCYYMLKNRKF